MLGDAAPSAIRRLVTNLPVRSARARPRGGSVACLPVSLSCGLPHAPRAHRPGPRRRCHHRADRCIPPTTTVVVPLGRRTVAVTPSGTVTSTTGNPDSSDHEADTSPCRAVRTHGPRRVPGLMRCARRRLTRGLSPPGSIDPSPCGSSTSSTVGNSLPRSLIMVRPPNVLFRTVPSTSSRERCRRSATA